jgi:hypothetical protein
MSSNRLKYDDCSFKKDLSQSVSPLDYVMDRVRFEHRDKCRNEMGLVGGPAVSHIKGNMVDLESDLIGITRPASQCPSMSWARPTGDVIRPKDYMKFSDMPEIDISKEHLQSCQMVDYKHIPTSQFANLPNC